MYFMIFAREIRGAMCAMQPVVVENGRMVNVRGTKKVARECFQEDAFRSHGPAGLRQVWEGSNLRVRRR